MVAEFLFHGQEYRVEEVCFGVLFARLARREKENAWMQGRSNSIRIIFLKMALVQRIFHYLPTPTFQFGSVHRRRRPHRPEGRSKFTFD
jgi:hypothetical protein